MLSGGPANGVCCLITGTSETALRGPVAERCVRSRPQWRAPRANSYITPRLAGARRPDAIWVNQSDGGTHGNAAALRNLGGPFDRSGGRIARLVDHVTGSPRRR